MSTELKIELDHEWIKSLPRPLFIAGPCSAESREQVIKTAQEIAKIPQISFYRAGVWKPRTRPNTFEGMGTASFEWLKEAQKLTGLKPIIEVSSKEHVEEALKSGLTNLWLGARTTVNPFLVQEIADALKGKDVVVMIKNPINPDINLWIGALERINQAGIKKIVAIHRGFSPFEKIKYRNHPQWRIPIELKCLLPQLPIICDPSHVSGTREFILEISQQAIDFNMDGLMIESHITPDKALSDAQQQITPEELKTLLSKLVFRKMNAEEGSIKGLLDDLRHNLDHIDEEILQKISERINVVKKIGNLKQKSNIALLQVDRWNNALQSKIKRSSELGVNKDFVEAIFNLFHNEALRIQSNDKSKE